MSREAFATVAVKEPRVLAVKMKPAKAKKASAKDAGHLSYAQMILEAVTTLGYRKGASLAAIKTFMLDYYEVDLQKQKTLIIKAVKRLVETGQLTQVTGKGASGSFKLPKEGKPATEKKKKLARRTKPTKKEELKKGKKKAAPKKTASKK